ncbi:MAG: hypothetical protein IJ697_02000 [Synergistaceae bacterium]|nr:hypothetical protein [Synergistaceae bacterium]
MWKECIVEGLKKFAGEIIGVLLLVLVLWAFPSVRELFREYENLKEHNSQTEIERPSEVQPSTEAQHEEAERLKEALNKAEAQR